MRVVEQCFHRFFCEAKGDWQDAHERTVAVGVGIAAAGLLCRSTVLNSQQGVRCRAADVKGFAVRGPFEIPVPADKTVSHVRRVELRMEQALRRGTSR